MPFLMKFCRALWLAPFSALALLLLAAQGLLLWRAPAWQVPVALEIRLSPGADMSLGRETLPAAHAEATHLRLRRDTAGRWFAANASSAKSVLVREGERETRLRTLAIEPGTGLRIAGTALSFAQAGEELVWGDEMGRSWRYDGFFLHGDGQRLPACPDTPLRQRLLAAWNTVAPLALRVERPLRWGGLVYCGNRYAMAGMAQNGAQIARESARWIVRANGATAIQHRGSGEGGEGAWRDLARQEIVLTEGMRLILGHTRFEVSATGDVLVLQPTYRVRRFLARAERAEAAVVWHWAPDGLWRLPVETAALAWLALPILAFGALLGCLILGKPPFAGRMALAPALAYAGGLVLASLGLATLGLGQRLGAGWLAVVFSLATLAWLAVPARGGLAAWLAVLWAILLALGMASLLELGLGAEESHWLRHYQRAAALAVFGLGLGIALRLALLGRLWSWPPFAGIDTAMTLLALAACLAMFAQWLVGGETGVAGVQPAEFAKLMLVTLSAHALACRSEWDGAAGPSPAMLWLRHLLPVALALSLILLALTLVYDYSPIVLLAFWGVGLCLAWGLATGNRRASALALALAGAGLAALAWLRTGGMADLADLGFYGDRFSVWLAPELHPHTGEQLLKSLRAIQGGGWFGTALASATNGAVMALPAVESDFAPSFFLHRHGIVGGVGLAVLQAWLVFAIAWASLRASRAGAGAGDYRRAWALRCGGFALGGGAALLHGHFLVSWGTNTGALPVMGQPMPLLSAGGSHLLFFLFPLLITSVILAEESRDESP